MKILGSIFTDTSRLHQRYHHSIFKSFNLHRGQSRLLSKLSDNEEINQRELTNRMNVSPATLTRIVQNMERNGFITRTISQKDQRNTIIKLTPKGAETKDLLNKKLKAVDKKIFEDFTTDEKEILHNYLLRIQDKLQEEMKIENNI